MHCVAPSAEVSPFAHGAQLNAPSFAEYVPAAHGVFALVPSQCEPAGQAVQLVRVVGVPPDVKEPAVHSEQPAALFPLYL